MGVDKLRPNKTHTRDTMKVLFISCIAIAVASGQRTTEQRAQALANQALAKGTAQLQALVNQYNIKGANGQKINVRNKVNQAMNQDKAQASGRQAGQMQAQVQGMVAQGQAQFNSARSEHGSTTVNQLLNMVFQQAS